MSSVQFRGVGKRFANGVEAIRDLDLTIRDSELFVLVGPSGSGKTTVLRLVAGLDRPSSGEILIDGARVDDAGARRHDIAMTFQQYALYPHMTVAENLGFPLHVRRVHARRVAARVREVAELLDIDEVLDRRPRRLSGGQQQRVALGRSMIREPRLFLMDEPLSSLDTKLRIESRSQILKLQRRLGTTTLYVTHDQVEAMALADRLAVVRDGRVVQTGPPSEIYERPVDMFVARFMGSPPMSIVRATVLRSGDDVVLRVGAQTLSLGPGALVRRPALRGMHGRQVAIGIRPEALRRDEAGSFVASVESTEALGPDRLVHASIDAPSVRLTDGGVTTGPDRRSTIATYVDAHDPVSLWEPLRLRVDTTGVHVFDLSTGAALDER
jgi:multiple sugar transport system ATP-binding protein